MERVRIRQDVGSNYRSVFDGRVTVRTRVDPFRPVGAPPTPELEDVAINDRCNAMCSYCYTSALKSGRDFSDVDRKAEEVWGPLGEDRPFQVAIGGAGEPTMHAGFPSFVATVRGLGIVPNYTTNGMHLTDDVLRATSDHCGGVAVSYHPHIGRVFGDAVRLLSGTGVQVNAHVIVGQPGTADLLRRVHGEHGGSLSHLVVLPYMGVGRAAGSGVDPVPEWRIALEWVASLGEGARQFAFGALFYDWFLSEPPPVPVDTYPPEVLSGYRIMDDSYRVLRRSSYDTTPKHQPA